MRWWVLVGVSSCLLGACAKHEAKAAEPNRLVLELGGDHPRLKDALARVSGKPVEAPLRTATEPGEEPKQEPKKEPKQEPKQEPNPIAKPAPDPRAPRRVRLAKGQTLYGLAAKELGDGKRWPEIAKLNGWDEDELTRLKEGVEVVLPAR